MDLLIAFFAGFVAALLGTMAGGGAGFFAFYALLFLGLPLNVAIATNKFGDLGFFPPALRNFARKGLLKPKIFWPLLILDGLGITIGTLLIVQLSEETIKLVVTFSLVPIFCLLAFRHTKNRPPAGKPSFLWPPAYLFSSMYTGVFGAGGGFVRMFALVHLRKLAALPAAANGFLSVFPFASLSVIVLLLADLVDIRLGVPLLIGNLVGAHFGSKVAIKQGSDFVRYMLLSLLVVTLVVLWVR